MPAAGDFVKTDSMGQLTWSKTKYTWSKKLTWNGQAPTKELTMKAHVSLAFAESKDPALVNFAGGVHTGLGANTATFTALPVTLLALDAAKTDFDGKLALAHKGSVAQTEAKDRAREVLIGLLRQLAAYVEGKAQGDASIIRLAGFDVAVHGVTAPTILLKPEILGIINFMTTQLKLRVSKVANAHAYEVQFRIGSGAWQGAGAFANTRAIVVINLVPGTLYEFRVRAIGGSTGTSDWSDAVSHMAT